MPRPLPPPQVDLLRHQALVIDTRPAAEYARTHIPGALSIPLRSQYAVWLGWLAPPETPLLFVLDGTPLGDVVDQSLLVGYERYVGVLEGGMEAWRASGRESASVAMLSPEDARAALRDGAAAIDVREPNEFAAGHVEGAIHVPLGSLESKLGEMPRKRALITYCSQSARASSAVSMLERAGYGPLFTIEGGFAAWQRAAQPVR